LPAGEVVTLSAGVVTRPAGRWDPNRTVELADDALYRAKHAGRDRVEVGAEAV
jgi:PleD family two-component response regulator